MNKQPPLEIVSAAASMLAPYIPGLTPATLLEALEELKLGMRSDKDTCPQKPYTRKSAADKLGVSVPTVDRYLAAGRRTRVRYSARAIRISAESVHNLMKGA